MTNKEWLGVYIGRLNPIHAGHENVVNTMIRDWQDQTMLILWSINKPLTWHNMFSYQERVWFIEKIYPWINIQWIPDYPTDDERLFALDQIIRSKYKGDMKNVVFYGWCEEDITYFVERDRTCKIINRFDWVSSPKVSATEIRDHLLRWEVLKDVDSTKQALLWKVNPIIQDQLIALFSEKLSKLKKI